MHLEHLDRLKKFHNKDTAFYYKFNAPSKKATETKIKKYNKDLLENVKGTNDLLSIFKKTTEFKAYLAEIYDSQDESYLFDFDDFDDFD
ncbi:MAG: hypothetical protein HC854_09295 [Flavobacterium sp.]|nr:hypothetical protein [Flavobacterium sp.]